MTRLLSFGVVLLAALTLVNSQRKLSEGAQKCFDQFMEGTIRRVKLGFCDVPPRIQADGGYAFDPEDMEIRIGNVLFNKKTKRTVLLKETEVQICMYGKLNTDRLRSSPAALQISAHGKPQSFPPIAGVKINLPDLGIDADFCDMEPNGCATTDPGCDTIAPGDGIKEFCSCSSLKVPDYAPAGTDVEVTWKVLEVPSDADPKVCEKDYDMDKLWSEKQKETLNCLKLNATVKACNELQENSRNKIDGC